VAEMTNRERVFNTLHHKPVDRIPTQVSPWGETIKRWVNEGHYKVGWDAGEHFGNAIRSAGWFNLVADLDFKPVVIEGMRTLREGAFKKSGDHTRDDLRRILELVKAKRIDLSKSITHRLPFDKLNDGIRMMEDKRENVVRIVIYQ